jgi:multidrug efflux pump
VAYVGTGSPRFYLPLDQQLPAPNFAQFVVLTRDIEAREALRSRLIDRFKTISQPPRNVIRLENGPPVGYPVQFRVLGPDIPTVRRLAGEVAAVMRGNPIWSTSTPTGTSSPRCCTSRWTSTRRACSA